VKLLARFLHPDCYRVAKVLQAYLDGEVDAATAGDVAGHLEHCRRCGLEAGTYRAIKSAIASGARSPIGGVSVDPAVLERLQAFTVALGERDGPGHDDQHGRAPDA
jgi:anti-sigma factor RsiW